MYEADDQLVSLAPVQHQLASLNDKYNRVYFKLEKAETKLKDFIETADEFNDAVAQLQDYVSETGAAIRDLPPVPVKADEIRKQLQDVQVGALSVKHSGNATSLI